MAEPKVRVGKLSEFRPQQANANGHTERGLAMLEKQMGKVGYVAPMTAAADKEIIDGSARLEESAVVFDDEALVLEHDGTRPIVMVRTDIPNAETPIAKQVSYGSNRIAEVDLSFSPAQIAADLAVGVDLSGLWFDWELSNIVLGGDGEIDPNAEWQGMPEFENEDAFGAIATVKVHFSSEEAIREFARLVGQTVTKESKFIWYPKQQRENLKQYIAKDES